MIVYRNVAQGSTEWLLLRMGRPTASCFDRIITPSGKPSSQASDYCNLLLAELMLGRPIETPAMPWMERGSLLEDDARAEYEFVNDVTVDRVGFCTTDDGLIGCSPDGLVGEDGLLELKCPKAEVHVGYLLLEDEGVQQAFWAQIPGQL